MSAVGPNSAANIDYTSTDPARNPYWQRVLAGDYISSFSPSEISSQPGYEEPNKFKKWVYAQNKMEEEREENKIFKYTMITLWTVGVVTLSGILIAKHYKLI